MRENAMPKNDRITLQFTGTDLRGLLDVMIEAVNVTKATGIGPAVEVNGKVFGLLDVAALIPDGDLSPDHQALISKIFLKRQRGYRRTAYNLAHRVNQLAEAARFQRYANSDASREMWMDLYRRTNSEMLTSSGLADATKEPPIAENSPPKRPRVRHKCVIIDTTAIPVTMLI
jgi:hypothetical protein